MLLSKGLRSVFTLWFVLFLSYNFCRLYLHHPVDVMANDEDDDEYGESEACEDGKDGRELVGYGTADATACPLFQ